MISIEKNCLFLINCNSDSPFFSCCPSQSSPWWRRSRPLEVVTWWECFRNEPTVSHCMKFIQFTKHNSNQFNTDDNSCNVLNIRWQQGWLLGFRPTQHRSNLFCPFWMKWSEVSMSLSLLISFLKFLSWSWGPPSLSQISFGSIFPYVYLECRPTWPRSKLFWISRQCVAILETSLYQNQNEKTKDTSP